MDELNNINFTNTNIRKLIIIIETYKSKTTDLLDLYTNVMKKLNSILVYLYYKLTVFKDYYNNKKSISSKFTKNILTQLKIDINGINRKNFDFIKEIYVKVIDNIINQMNQMNKKYVEYSKKSGILNLLVLTHLNSIKNLI